MTDSEQLAQLLENCVSTLNSMTINTKDSYTDKDYWMSLAMVAEKFTESKLSGYKAQVAGQAKYIECLLAEIRELNERIQEFVK